MNCFMYVNFLDEKQKEQQLVFPRLLDNRTKFFSFMDTRCCKNPYKLGTGRRFESYITSYIFNRAIGELLGIAKHCYTLEVSFFSYTDMSSKNSYPFTEYTYILLNIHSAIVILNIITFRIG